jgi:hypothetical protein
MEPQHPLLATTRGGLDQSAATVKRHHCGYVGDGRLTSGRGGIFPGSHRIRSISAFHGTTFSISPRNHSRLVRFLAVDCS